MYNAVCAQHNTALIPYLVEQRGQSKDIQNALRFIIKKKTGWKKMRWVTLSVGSESVGKTQDRYNSSVGATATTPRATLRGILIKSPFAPRHPSYTFTLLYYWQRQVSAKTFYIIIR